MYNIYWYLNYKCNLSCKHCWINASKDVKEDLLELKYIYQFINSISESCYSPTVIFSGGEPLIHKDFYDIIQHTNSKNIKFSLETNGINLYNNVDWIKKLENLYLIGVSLDGIEENHDYVRGKGAYKGLIRSLEQLKEHHVSKSVQCIINNKNKNDIDNLINIIRDLNIDNIIFGFTNIIGRAKENKHIMTLNQESYDNAIERIINSAIKNPNINYTLKTQPALIKPDLLLKINKVNNLNLLVSCDFPKIGILPNGDISICSLVKDNFNIGNIKNNKYESIIFNNLLKKIKKNYNNIVLEGVCKECIFKEKCKGSCRSYAYEEYDDFTEAFPLCQSKENQGSFYKMYKVK